MNDATDQHGPMRRPRRRWWRWSVALLLLLVALSAAPILMLRNWLERPPCAEFIGLTVLVRRPDCNDCHAGARPTVSLLAAAASPVPGGHERSFDRESCLGCHRPPTTPSLP